MAQGNNRTQSDKRHNNPAGHEIKDTDKQQAAAAHNAAEKDIEKDPEFSAHSPNDDLDEGETARLGEDTRAII